MSDLKEKSERTRKTDRTFASASVVHMKCEAIRAPRRPLRTYSKRTIPTDSAEPPVKRQRIDEVHCDPQPQRAQAKPDLDVSAPQDSLPTLPPAAPARKGTITAYFKKIEPPTSSSTLPSEVSSDNIEPAITPPSSPPVLNTRRTKTRRLTRRAVARDSEEKDNENGEPENSRADERAAATEEEPLGQEDKRRALTSVDSHTLNLPKKQSEVSKRGKAATVQTTLSLSLTDTGFVECKDCKMLYNPLHEKDAKDHARIHAALRRATSRTRNRATD